jgi:hypothetical protein
VWESIETVHELAQVAVLVGVDQKALVLAACGCARSVLHLVAKGEERPRLAIEAAEKWTPEAYAATITANAANVAAATNAAAWAAWAAAVDAAAGPNGPGARHHPQPHRVVTVRTTGAFEVEALEARGEIIARSPAHAPREGARGAHVDYTASASDLLRAHLPWKTILAALTGSGNPSTHPGPPG